MLGSQTLPRRTRLYSLRWGVRIWYFGIPILVFLALLIRYAQNIPATDDFLATVQFVYRFFHSNLTTGQQAELLFSQHNEHRIVISRLITLLLYKLTGEVNLRYFLFIDVLFLVGLLSVLTSVYKSLRPVLLWYHYLLPLLLLLSPHSYETFLFVSGGSQSYAVLFFTTLSMWALYRAALNKERTWAGLFSLAIVSACLATFSFGSGFLVWAGGSAFLYYKRLWTWLVAWLLVAVSAVGLYFYHFYRPITDLALTNPFSTQLLSFIKGVLLFPGAAFMIHWPNFRAVSIQVVICYGVGVISWGYILYLLLTGYGRKNPLLFSLLGISLGVGFMLSLNRIGVGSGFMFTSRYLVFTSMTPIILYAIGLDQGLPFFRKTYWPALLAFLLFAGSLVTNLPMIDEIYTSRQEGFNNWQRTGGPTLYIEPSSQAQADQIIRQSIEKHIFVPDNGQAGKLPPH